MSACCPILMNIHAGALHAVSGEEELRRMARDAGLEVRITVTRSAADMNRELRRLIDAGAEKVGIAGGDGTIQRAVQTLAHSPTALGILSQGTFNNFATALRVPHNLPAALRTLRDGVVREVDLGQAGDYYFTESAGVGLFADALAVYRPGRDRSLLRGLYACMRLVPAFRAGALRLTLDGSPRADRVILCEVANTYRIAQAVPIAPEASLTDGQLDVVLVGEVRWRELPGYLRALRAQVHLGLPRISSHRAREVRLETRRPWAVHAGDQVIGVTPVTITVQPRALKVLVDERL